MRSSRSSRNFLVALAIVGPVFMLGCSDEEPLPTEVGSAGSGSGKGGAGNAAGKGGGAGVSGAGGNGATSGSAGNNGGAAGKAGAAGSAGSAGAAGKAGSAGTAGGGGMAGAAGAGNGGTAGSGAGSGGAAGVGGGVNGGSAGSGGQNGGSLGLASAPPAALVGELTALDTVVAVLPAGSLALATYEGGDVGVLDLRDATAPITLGKLATGGKAIAVDWDAENRIALVLRADGVLQAFALLHPESPTKLMELATDGTTGVVGLARLGKRLVVAGGTSLSVVRADSTLGVTTLTKESAVALSSAATAIASGGDRLFVARTGASLESFSVGDGNALVKGPVQPLDGEVVALVGQGTTAIAAVKGKGLRAFAFGTTAVTSVFSNDELSDVRSVAIFGKLLVASLDRGWVSTLDISRLGAPRAVTTNKDESPVWVTSLDGNLLLGKAKQIVVRGVPPFVTAAVPAAIASALPLSGKIPITLSKPVDPLSLVGSPGQLLCGTKSFPLTAKASIDRLRVVFRAAEPLPVSTSCNLVVGEVKDLFGNPISAAPDTPAATFTTAASAPVAATIKKSAFPHTADGTFTTWTPGTPPQQFEYFDVPAARGMYSFFYADFDGERLWLLNDWAHGAAAIDPECYNQFSVYTGDGAEQWDIRSYGDQRIEIRKDGALLEAGSTEVLGGYAYAPSPNEASPHTQYELGIKAAPGAWGIALHDPGPTFQCHTLELEPTAVLGTLTSGGGSTVDPTSEPPVPGAASLASPANDSSGFPVEGSFLWTPADSWQAIPGYRVEIGTGPLTSRPFFSTLWFDTTFRAPKGMLAFASTYWWRVTAFNVSGEASTTLGTFTTEAGGGQGGNGGAGGASGAGGGSSGGLGERCDGFNEEGAVIDSSTGNRYFAIQYVPTESRLVSGIEFFTNRANAGPAENDLALFNDEGNFPGGPLVPATTFSPSSSKVDWYGGALSSPVSVTAGTTYWIVWRPQSGQQTPFAASGTKLTYTGSATTSGWEGKFTDNPMIRISCDGGGSGGAGGAGGGGAAGASGQSGAGGAAGQSGSAGQGGAAGAPLIPSCAPYPCEGAAISDNGNAEPRGVFADATGVYWANRGSSTIRRANLDGTGASDFADNLASLGNLYGDETYLYAPQYAGAGGVHRISKVTGTVDTLVTVEGASLHGFDFFDGAFWITEATSGSSNNATIYKLIPGEAQATVYTTGQRDRLFTITHDATTAYLMSQGPSSVGMGGIVQAFPRPLPLEIAPLTTITELSYPIGGQVYKGYLYIADSGSSRILRVAIGTNTKEEIASCTGSGTYGLWVYDDVVYFSCSESNLVRAVAIPTIQPLAQPAKRNGQTQTPSVWPPLSSVAYGEKPLFSLAA